MPRTDIPLFAALVPQNGLQADQLLADFVAGLRQRGIQVRGLLQEMQPCAGGCSMFLRDIETGHAYPISQNLGSHSAACTLDPGGIADASIVLRRIADEGAELAVCNRFSGLEASGEGFAAEMLDLMCCGIPLITIVQEKHLAAWRHFTGDIARELPPDLNSLEDWFSTVRQGEH